MGFPETTPETRIWGEVIYLGCDSRKPSKQVRQKNKCPSEVNYWMGFLCGNWGSVQLRTFWETGGHISELCVRGVVRLGIFLLIPFPQWLEVTLGTLAPHLCRPRKCLWLENNPRQRGRNLQRFWELSRVNWGWTTRHRGAPTASYLLPLRPWLSPLWWCCVPLPTASVASSFHIASMCPTVSQGILKISHCLTPS